MKHKWGKHKFGSGWSRCVHCGISRLYDYMPGWPGWYVFFSADGKVEYDKEPRCSP